MLNIAQLLGTVPYFAKVAPEDLEEYAKTAKVRHVECGETVIREGEVDDRIFIVMDGRLRASSTRVRKGEMVVGEIGRGEVLGETAALVRVPRGATVTALRHSILLEITADDLIGLVRKDSETLMVYSKNLLQRSRPDFAYQQNSNSLLLFPLHPGIDLSAFARSLAGAVRHHSPVHLATPDQFEVSEPAPLAAACVDLESKHPMVVYVSGGEWDTWTQVAARRCDRVLFVGQGDQAGEMGAAEKQLWEELKAANHARVELAILHSSESVQPRNTKRWFVQRAIDRHYHIARDSEKSFAKLARFLTGNAIGYALSGGGFKAGMQVGALCALEEAGIPLDILGGSSGGAFAAAMFAKKIDLKTLPEMIPNALEQFRKAGKWTLPMISLFTGKHLTRGFRHFLGDVEIEDLWRTYFCTSLNLVDGAIHAHQRGPLWEAVRASSAIMALFPPVLKGDACLVDGGFVNPCPTNVLHQMGAGKIVVLSAFESGGVEMDAYFSPEASGWGILKKKLNPFFRQKISPSLGANVVQSMMFASEHLLREIYSDSKIDVLIEPDLSAYSSQDRSAIKTFYEIGYNYARERAAEWKEILLP